MPEENEKKQSKTFKQEGALENQEKKEEAEKKTEKEEEKEEVIANLTRERDQYLADWQRARAELINYKKEEGERIQQALRFANERIIKELIFILDNFDLALQSMKEIKDLSFQEERILQGVILIKGQIEDLLKKEGVTEIPVQKGEKPVIEYQEIVAEIETTQVLPGTIAEIFQKGYIYNGKIIRPARIALAKEKSDSKESK